MISKFGMKLYSYIAYIVYHFLQLSHASLAYNAFVIPGQTEMSCLTTKPTIWHAGSVKTQISLGIRPVFTVRMKNAWVLERTAKTDQTGQMPRMI